MDQYDPARAAEEARRSLEAWWDEASEADREAYVAEQRYEAWRAQQDEDAHRRAVERHDVRTHRTDVLRDERHSLTGGDG